MSLGPKVQIPAKVAKQMMKKYGGKKKRRTNMPKAPTGSFASRQETFSIAATDGVVYDLNTLSLAQLPVSSQLANFYQYYRITSIQMRFKPVYDTFLAPGAGSAPALPYLYFLFDKSGSLGSLNAVQFEESGAKPQRFDDKTLIRKWRPSVLTTDGSGTVSQFKVSPWLPTHDTSGTNVNVVNHLGAVWYMSKMNGVDSTTYDIDVTVTVQFRKPLVVPTAGTQSVNALTLIKH